ncbi:penicillin-binding transpeptidase domain-containing protein [Bacillus sp. SL00103]
MAGAFSAFGNNGYYNEPHAVTSVEFNDGTKLDLTPDSKAAMSDYTAFMVTDMLKLLSIWNWYTCTSTERSSCW